MNKEQAVVSTFKGSTLGIILVLFILLVIVVSVFCGSSFNNSGVDEDLSIASSRNFRLTNDSSSSVVLTLSRGDFEPPGPPAHVAIPPNTYYGFEVSSVLALTRTAYAGFGIVLGGTGVGVMETTLVSGRAGTYSGWVMDRFTSTVVTYTINGTNLTLTDAPVLL
ncbi:hypothetical protein [Paenibacillus herberti]|uniref:hypothetical protein n=1 Tax=Paenibacillus herberti TaxID=1619309 RepID=UPI001130B8BA|nr:hypothetical protein [Paenibacillus herberti]